MEALNEILSFLHFQIFRQLFGACQDVIARLHTRPCKPKPYDNLSLIASLIS